MGRKLGTAFLALACSACVANQATPESRVVRPGGAVGASAKPALSPEGPPAGGGPATGGQPGGGLGNGGPGPDPLGAVGPSRAPGGSAPPASALPSTPVSAGQAGWVPSGPGFALTGLPGPGEARLVPGPLPGAPKALAVVQAWPVVGGSGARALSLGRKVLKTGYALGHREVGGALIEAFPDWAEVKPVTALAGDGAGGLLLASGASVRRLALRADALGSPEAAFTSGEELVAKAQEAPEVAEVVALAVAAKPVALTGQALPDDAASLSAVGPFPLAAGSVVAVDANQHRVLLLQRGAGGAWSRRVLMGQGRVAGAGGSVPALEDFSVPSGVALRPDGRAIAIADTGRRRLVLMEAAATAPGGVRVRLLAGDGSPGAQNGPGATASFARPVGLAYAPSGLLYVADEGNQALRSVDATGVVRSLRVAGLGTPRQLAWAGDGRLWVLGSLGLMLAHPGP